MRDEPRKLYILTREDLGCSQRIVQSCHALGTLMARHGADPKIGRWAEHEGALVVLGVKDEQALSAWEEELRVREVRFEPFREPDLGGQLTALAVHPAADARLFRKLSLL
jgi:hypothetical protein